MKQSRIIPILLTVLLFAVMPAAAQQTADDKALITDEQIVVLPKDVYVGDQMEIRYTFTTSIDLSANTQLPTKLIPPEMDELTILSITLSDADSTGGNGYVLSVQCIPWKSGIIDIPEITDQLTLSLDIPPITIQSILLHTGNQELRSIKAPILIPGTTWIIWFIVLIILIFCGGIIFFIGLLKKRGLTLKEFWYMVFSTPYYRRAMRVLRRMTKKGESFSDMDWAHMLSQCIRMYLSERFQFEFDAVSSSDIVFVFAAITDNTQDETITSRMEILEQILVRMDYIRFSGASDGSATLTADERATVIKSVREIIRFFEKGEKQDAAV